MPTCMQKFWDKLDLKAKIIAILILISVPTFLLVTLTANKLTKPLLEQEIKTRGLQIANSIASDITYNKWFKTENTEQLENLIQETIGINPGIIRIDIVIKSHKDFNGTIVASNFEIDKDDPKFQQVQLSGKAIALEEKDENIRYWKISVPIILKNKKLKPNDRLLGNVNLSISMKLVSNVLKTFWTISALSSIVTFFTLVIVFNYVFKKTITNDRTLRIALTQNLELSTQLHDLEQKLLTSEKLAVMGQLTAKFAHEVGTPLNSIGGHLHLLKEEIEKISNSEKSIERISIIHGELLKIETIVRNFLKVTKKPLSPVKNLNINDIIEKTVALVRPKAEVIGVNVIISQDKNLKPYNAASFDLEHLLLNLINNSLDSLEIKRINHPDSLSLDIITQYDSEHNSAKIIVFDTGVGIKSDYLDLAMEPFFTTKDPMKGTGLGLSICKDIVRKYGGVINIESEENKWTRVKVSLPYMEIV